MMKRKKEKEEKKGNELGIQHKRQKMVSFNSSIKHRDMGMDDIYDSSNSKLKQ